MIESARIETPKQCVRLISRIMVQLKTRKKKVIENSNLVFRNKIERLRNTEKLVQFEAGATLFGIQANGFIIEHL